MARPKSYNRDDALRRVLEAFWQHGYGALGVREIEQQTGLNQFAIRTEFGGKEGLYLEALNLYAAQAEIIALAPMSKGGATGIAKFFGDLINENSPVSSKWGCLIVNIGVENATIGNAKLAAVADNYWRSLKAHFSTALQKSKAGGELAADLDIADASNALVVAVMGIHTMNRISRSQTAGAPMVKAVQHWINGWRC